jgi:hypothetical protein
MRIKLLLTSCFLAAVFLVIALRATWGSGTASDSTRFDISLHGVSHVYHPWMPWSAKKECTYLTGKGSVEYCAPAPGGDAPFSMLCSVFALIASGLVLALASFFVTYVSPYRAKGTSAALAAASLAAVFIGTVAAQLSMQRALKVFEEIPLYLDGLGFTSAWIAIGLLLFAAGLSTTSTMLRHE